MKSVAAILFLFLISLVLPGLAHSVMNNISSVKSRDGKIKFEEKMGIKITKLALSGEGYVIDFRFRVLDPDKAMKILDPDMKPHLIERATGRKFFVPTAPKLGSLRQKTGRPETGRIYFILFSNPGKTLKKGAMVSFVMGQNILENITVE